MAIIVKTNTPSALLSAIKQGIEKKLVITWSCDGDGDFTHTPDQWRAKAWLRPRVGTGQLLCTIIPRKDSPISKEVYAIYHGRFIEMLLAHFDDRFTNAFATALPEQGDVIGGQPSS